ncbi:MAG: hypothetical protein ACRDL3_15735, partial [Solirubrobacterales bacterium]
DSGGDPRLSSPQLVEASVGPTLRFGRGAQPHAIHYAEGSIWVAGWDRSERGFVTRIDPDTSKVVARIRLEGGPGWETGGDGIAAGGGAVGSRARAMVGR